MADEASAVLDRLRPTLGAAGFDLAVPLLAGWYNDEPHIAPLPDAHKLPAPPSALAVLVGNSRALWSPFMDWVGERLDRDPKWAETHADPLDEYTQEVINRALAAPGVPAAHVVYAYETLETHGRAVSVTTAAHVSGLAFYHAELQRSIHATLGPWIAYRAILIFDSITPQCLRHPDPPADPCAPPTWTRVGDLQRECFSKWGAEPDEVSWARLVEIARAFEMDEFAYDEEQIQFHYAPSAEARSARLADCAARRAAARSAVI